VNNPAITVSVVLDSPVGAHHGGDVAAPIFRRIAQQVLAYLNTPHDVDPKDAKRIWLRASAKPEEMEDESPDRPGDTADLFAAEPAQIPPAAIASKKDGPGRTVVPSQDPPAARHPLRKPGSALREVTRRVSWFADLAFATYGLRQNGERWPSPGGAEEVSPARKRWVGIT